MLRHAVRATARPPAAPPSRDERVPSAPDPPARSGIVVTGLGKRFRRLGGEEVVAIDDISLTVEPGEFLVLLGPSGCGKTTLLRCLAGLEHPDHGTIEIDGRTVYSSHQRVEMAPEHRQISMMFQSYALWPHMTVFDNVAYPLRSRRDRAAGSRRGRQDELRDRVASVLARVHCEHLADQYPGSISGGQQQRVALARSLVADDHVVLFDEPLSNVDAKVREELRFELLDLQRKIGFTAVYVTHDQVEALALADRIALLRGGRVEQIGGPTEVYRRPKTRHVAQFLGTINDLEGAVGGPEGQRHVTTAVGDVRVGDQQALGQDGERVVVSWRPEDARLSQERPAARENVWPVTVTTEVFLGSHREYAVDANGVTLRVWRMAETEIPEGARAWLTVDPDAVLLFRDR